MNTSDDQSYNPADDDNQGVVQLLAQGEEANQGVSQVEYISPVTDQGPEPEKDEVNPSEIDGVNDDILAEEDVETGNVEEKNEE